MHVSSVSVPFSIGVIVCHMGKHVKSKQNSNIIVHKLATHEYEVLNMCIQPLHVCPKLHDDCISLSWCKYMHACTHMYMYACTLWKDY